jgi:hypothetical protein
MSKTTVGSVVAIDKYILIVFYTDARCWQFRVIGFGGVVYGERRIYYTAEAAEKAGREWITSER